MTMRDVAARSAFATWALLAAYMAIVHSCLWGTWLFPVIIIITSTLILLDLFFNDLMSERFGFKWGLEYRKWVYAVAAFSYSSHLFVAEHTSKSVHLDMLFVFSFASLFALMLSFRNLLHVRGQACSEL
jgi:hypothetical protein